MATYYKKIKGKNYDKKLVDAADSSVKGRGDGRISLNDAKKILRAVKDSSEYSDIEKSTMKYIRDHYDFTPEADRWFRAEIRKWAATKGAGAKKTKKTAPRTRPGKAAPAVASPRNEAYEEPEGPASHAKVGTQKQESKSSLLRRIIQFILIIIIAVFIFLLLIPSSRKFIQSRFSSLIGTSGQKAPEQEKPVLEQPKAAPAEEAVKPEVKPESKPEKAAEDGDYYTVQVKDDLISISEKVLGSYAKWIDLYNANKDTIKNPTLIFPGQKLKLPQAKQNKN